MIKYFHETILLFGLTITVITLNSGCTESAASSVSSITGDGNDTIKPRGSTLPQKKFPVVSDDTSGTGSSAPKKIIPRTSLPKKKLRHRLK